MSAIKHRQPNASPEIDYGEIYIPDENNLGTGKFTTVLKKGVLVQNKPIVSIMINRPAFQISVNINPQTSKIPVLLGKADGSNPKDRVIFSLPDGINKTVEHTFVAEFEDWKIRILKLNGISLERIE